MSVTIVGLNVRCDKYDDKTGNQKHKKLFQKSSKGISAYDGFPDYCGDKPFCCLWNL